MIEIKCAEGVYARRDELLVYLGDILAGTRLTPTEELAGVLHYALQGLHKAFGRHPMRFTILLGTREGESPSNNRGKG